MSFKLGRLTDYAVVMLGHMHDAEHVTARELALRAQLPLSTTQKLCKILHKGGIFDSIRGKEGGYCLKIGKKSLSVLEILQVMEGPIFLTSCVAHAPYSCQKTSHCKTMGRWNAVNERVRDALSSVMLSEMVG